MLSQYYTVQVEPIEIRDVTQKFPIPLLVYLWYNWPVSYYLQLNIACVRLLVSSSSFGLIVSCVALTLLNIIYI